MGEKALGQIFGVVRFTPPPAQIGIKWLPIGSAKLLECIARFGSIASIRGQHNAPMRILEPRTLRGGRWSAWLRRGHGLTISCFETIRNQDRRRTAMNMRHRLARLGCYGKLFKGLVNDLLHSGSSLFCGYVAQHLGLNAAALQEF